MCTEIWVQHARRRLTRLGDLKAFVGADNVVLAPDVDADQAIDAACLCQVDITETARRSGYTTVLDGCDVVFVKAV